MISFIATVSSFADIIFGICTDGEVAVYAYVAAVIIVLVGYLIYCIMVWIGKMFLKKGEGQ